MVHNEIKTSSFKKLLNRYDYETLDSISFMIENNSDYKNSKVWYLLKIIMLDKYVDNYKEYNKKGKDMSYYRRVKDFDISEVVSTLHLLSPKKQDFLFDIASESLERFSKNEDYYAPVINGINKLMDQYSEIMTNRSNEYTVDDDFDIDELNTFFQKYSLSELEDLAYIFNYTNGLDTERMYKVYKKMVNEKYFEYAQNNGFPILNNSLDIQALAAKNTFLTDKELEMFGKLVETSFMCLDSIIHMNVAYEKQEIGILLDTIESDLQVRKEMNKYGPKVISLVPNSKKPKSENNDK